MTLTRVITDGHAGTLAPLPRAEDVDLLALDPVALLEHVVDVRDELRAVRAALHEAVAQLARREDEICTARRTIEYLRCQARKERHA
jgi:hypothetical protein